MFCFTCHASCGNCNGPSKDHCTACATGYYMQLNTNGSNKGCFTTCPDGYYKRDSDLSCQKCSADHCTICTTGDSGVTN